ncbi:MAG: GNAT family N-acetyltransferase [Parafilimonas sp.]
MQTTYEAVDGVYHITTNISEADVNVVHQFLSKESYWAKEIPKHVVEKAIENSLCFGLFYKNNLIGFGRLITDKAMFAYLADVFILKEFRGKGLSKWLMRIIQLHPELQNLKRWLLTTKDAHGLYEQLGWQKPDADYLYRFMMRQNLNAYTNTL